MDKPIYKRVCLKLSGEGLMGDRSYGLSPVTVEQVAGEIKQVWEAGTQVCITVGGGNIFRGVSGATQGMDRATADYMGMLATVINAIALQDALERVGVDTRVLSALPVDAVCEPYIRRKAIGHLDKGRVVIFAAGTGNPFFTSDTGSALRAAEMGCDAILKATQVDGVYDKDPKKFPDAKRYETINYQDIFIKGLKVLDAAAVSIAQDNNIPILVFKLSDKNAFLDVVFGGGFFTKIHNGD